MRWKSLGLASMLAGLVLVGSVWSLSLASTSAAGPPADGGDGQDLPATALHFAFVATVTASDGGLHDEFAKSLALDGDTLLVGSPAQYATSPNFGGAAYVYYRDRGGMDHWGEVTRLSVTEAISNRNFGWSVALDGDTAVVGAHAAYTPSQTVIGAVYVFYRDQGGSDNWGKVRTLSYPDRGIDAFGYSVAIDEDTIAVGARARNNNGSAFVFYRDQGGPDNWGFVAELTETSVETASEFGRHVAVDGDTLVVTAPFADAEGDGNRGRAFVYERNRGGSDNWGLTKELTPVATVESVQLFGDSADLEGDLIAVGATGADFPGIQNRGAVYFFSRDQGGTDAWGQLAMVTSFDRPSGIGVGASESIYGLRVLGGTPAAYDNGTGSGAAYLFYQDGGVTTYTQVLAPDGAEWDRFGTDVSLTDGAIAVGAPWKVLYGENLHGQAYVFYAVVYTNAAYLPVGIKD